MLDHWNDHQKYDPYPVETKLDDKTRSDIPHGLVSQDAVKVPYQTVIVKAKKESPQTPLDDLDPTPNIPTNPLLFDLRPPEDPDAAFARYAANLKAAELAADRVPDKDPEIEDDPLRVAKQLELDANLKKEAAAKSAARKKRAYDDMSTEPDGSQGGAPLTRFGMKGAIVRPRSKRAKSNFQTAKEISGALLGLFLKTSAPPKTAKQQADATAARLAAQQEKVDMARRVLGDSAFEAKVESVLKRLGPNKLQKLPGQDDVTYKADVDSAQRQRAEMVVSGQGDPDGGPDPRGYLERIKDDWLKRVVVGLPLLGGFNFDEEDDPMDEDGPMDEADLEDAYDHAMDEG